MTNLKLELIEIIAHCGDVKTFRFALREKIVFQPGQYLSLTLDINARSAAKPFSISNSPTEKGFLQFTKKMTDSIFSQALDRLTVGQECALRLPMGTFIFNGQFKKAAFLSGGIGVTPIRSIFKYAADKGLSSSLVLLYSGRIPEYLIFRNDFDIMSRVNKNLKVVYTLTHCQQNTPGCRTGFINADVIRDEIPDFKERVFYVSGPAAMVADMRSMCLDDLGVSARQIITEKFTGY